MWFGDTVYRKTWLKTGIWDGSIFQLPGHWKLVIIHHKVLPLILATNSGQVLNLVQTVNITAAHSLSYSNDPHLALYVLANILESYQTEKCACVTTSLWWISVHRNIMVSFVTVAERKVDQLAEECFLCREVQYEYKTPAISVISCLLQRKKHKGSNLTSKKTRGKKHWGYSSYTITSITFSTNTLL